MDIGDLIECEQERVREWGIRWDCVTVEAVVGPVVSDLLLTDGGRLSGVIEVRSTHEVDPEKADFYLQLGLRWIEVAASSELFEGERRWTAGVPLVPIRIGAEPPWVCPACAWGLARCTDVGAEWIGGEVAEVIVRAFRLLDVHLPRGGWSREVYLVKEACFGGSPRAIRVETHRGDNRIDCPLSDGLAGAISIADQLTQDWKEEAARQGWLTADHG